MSFDVQDREEEILKIYKLKLITKNTKNKINESTQKEENNNRTSITEIKYKNKTRY
jgi:hypothetical protein